MPQSSETEDFMDRVLSLHGGSLRVMLTWRASAHATASFCGWTVASESTKEVPTGPCSD